MESHEVTSPSLQRGQRGQVADDSSLFASQHAFDYQKQPPFADRSKESGRKTRRKNRSKEKAESDSEDSDRTVRPFLHQSSDGSQHGPSRPDRSREKSASPPRGKPARRRFDQWKTKGEFANGSYLRLVFCLQCGRLARSGIGGSVTGSSSSSSSTRVAAHFGTRHSADRSCMNATNGKGECWQ